MKKSVIKMFTLLLSVSLASCNIGVSSSENKTTQSSEQPVVSSTTSNTTESIVTSSSSTSSSSQSQTSISSSSSSSSASSTSNSSSSTSSSESSSSNSSTTSSGTVIETETLDSTIAKLLDGLNAHVPSLNSYNLDYEVFYHYSVEEFVVRGYSYNNGSDLEAELYNVFSSFNGLECMNHDEYNTYEEYGYLFGNDEYGSEFFFNFCAIEDYFYIEVVRIEGAGSLDISKIDTNWYVDFVNYGQYEIVNQFPNAEINAALGTNVTIPHIGEGKFPFLFSEAHIEDGSIYPDCAYTFLEGDKIADYVDLLNNSGFKATLTRNVDYDEYYQEYVYYTATAYDTNHTVYLSFALDDSTYNTIIGVYRFEDVLTDTLTENTDWTYEEKALMNATLFEELPFMKFGDDYAIEQTTDWMGYDLLFLGDYYYEDLTNDYIDLLLKNGYKEDSTTYDETYYVKDNGAALIEITVGYDNGNCLWIYFSESSMPQVKSLSLNTTELEIVKGESYQLVVSYEPSDANNNFTWSSSNESIATVDQTGLVTINSEAATDSEVTITVKAVNGLSASCKFTVKDNTVSGVKFEKELYTVKPGETVKTDFTLLPYGMNDVLFTVSYAVEPNNVGISVDENGKITAEDTAIPGTEATLTLTYNGQFTATANIKVVAPTVTHTLTPELLGLDGTSPYKAYSATTEDGAVYEAFCSNGTGIQLKSKDNCSGIIGHMDGMKCQSITINFDKSTNSSRVIDIYASNEPFEIEDMYGSSVKKVGSIAVSDTSKTYAFTDSYAYIGIRSNYGAVYMTSIDIIWG